MARKAKLRSRGFSASSGAAPVSGVGFTPWQPQDRPPAGSYDPTLDANSRSSTRGLDQYLSDNAKAGSRAETQWQLDRADITRGRDRSLADLMTRETRGGEDYTRAVGGLDRRYQQLASGQSQAAAASGVGLGGALVAAARARRSNYALDRQPIDTSWSRERQDIGTARDRTNENASLALSNADRQYGYGVVDRAEGAQRATDDNTFYQQDVGAQRWFQAGQAGVVPPSRPSNEFTDPQGNPYRVLRRGKKTVGVNPAGRVLWSRKAGG